jgi:hypothetical protein
MYESTLSNEFCLCSRSAIREIILSCTIRGVDGLDGFGLIVNGWIKVIH